jgi:dihydrofolate reductase
MQKIRLDLSLSFDGYLAGPGAGAAHPMGIGGDGLHDWLEPARAGAGHPDHDAAAYLGSAGAFVVGRRAFDMGVPPLDAQAFGKPWFVVTRRAREPLAARSSTCRFVTEGPGHAIHLALRAAEGRDICIVGGAALARECLAAGMVDEVVVHVAPVLLHAGARLFDGLGPDATHLRQIEARPSAAAMHLRFEVLDRAPDRPAKRPARGRLRLAQSPA